jgi:hypothetical protein
MFPSSRFRGINCPLMPSCANSYCYFAHKHIRTNSVLVNASTQTDILKRSVPASSAEKTQHTDKKIKLDVSVKDMDAKPAVSRAPVAPTITPNIHSKIPRETRQAAVNAFFKQFLRIYQNILSQSPNLAHIHSLKY